jgi:cytochrome c-type biogenesis protein
VAEILTALTTAIEGSLGLAFAAAFVWGIASVLLSPCHLASIPLLVGFLSGHGKVPVRRALLVSTCFSIGILASIAAIGAITAAAGRIVGDVGGVANYVLAAVFFAFGLNLLGVFSLPAPSLGASGRAGGGPLSALGLGAVFGVALGPCSFAFMAPLLGVAFKLSAQRPLMTAGLLLTYAIGHCLVIVAAGTFTGWVQGFLDWTERSRGQRTLRGISGGLVLCAGLYFLYSAR